MAIFSEDTKKRYVSFSVKWTIFCLVLQLLNLIAYTIGHFYTSRIPSTPEERSVKEFIQEHKGEYTIIDNFDDRHIDSVCFENSDISDEDVMRLESLHKLHKIVLNKTKVTQTGLEKISRFPSVDIIIYNGQPYMSSSQTQIPVETSQTDSNQPTESVDLNREETQNSENIEP